VRYALVPITDAAAWAAATTIAGPPAPLPAGSPHSPEASLDLAPGSRVFFAIRSQDEAGNRSALSNSPFIDLPPGIE